MSDCLLCHAAIKGRSDKKFCDDHCRATFHNRKEASTNAFIRKINSVLRRNRKLLYQIFSHNSQAVKKSSLTNLGFDFNHFTHFKVLPDNKSYRFCYDFGYCEEDEYVLIIKDQSILNQKNERKLKINAFNTKPFV